MTDRIEVKAQLTASEDGTIEGVAWPYATPDRTGDVITKGALNTPETLPMLFGHDQGQVVGVWDQIAETDDGLTVKGRLLIDDVARAREVRAMVTSKAVTGLSIGFITKAATPQRRGRQITKADVLEISVVAVPAHPGARITSAKSQTLENDMSEETETLEQDTAEIEKKMGEIEGALESLPKIAARLDKLEAKANRPSDTETRPKDEPTEERKAFTAYLRYGQQAPADELKNLIVSNDEQGGYLAPAEMSQEFIRDLVEFSPLRQFASVRAITSPSVKYPKRTGITNAQWEGEADEAQESSMTFGQLEVPSRKLMTFVDISNELLADSGGTADAEVRLALAEDFGQKEAVGFVNGTGVGQPEGLMTNPDIDHVVNGHATNLSPDKMVDMVYGLPAAYRRRGAWMMNGKTLGEVRKLKDGDGRFLWQASFQAGEPERILGYPVVEAVDMPDIGDGNFPIIFGDFSAYRIVDRLALSILVNPYILATKGMTRIHATRRVGGRVLQAARFRKLKTATS
ncbi:phage major capsid protein [Roseovarius sp. A46]|uniref:phage major capsid protein n=1 Tax=Roseovarius sp. A46 TaxID=2109331 RepID=UPI0010130618|nr:phage major capsid protein [Roseovarius sp. A46]RXV64867.1 phage major capsid protein [Roseovarius sp. A46]